MRGYGFSFSFPPAKKGIGKEDKPGQYQNHGANKDGTGQGYNSVAYQIEAGIQRMHGLDLLFEN